VDYRSDPFIAVIQGEEIDRLITEFFNRIDRRSSLSPLASAPALEITDARDQFIRDG